jgi:hypothetical protein
MYKSYRDMLSSADRDYIDSREKNWDFYNRRWKDDNDRFCSAMCKYFVRNLGETVAEFKDKQKITLGITTQIVDAIVDHVYGPGLSRTFPDAEGADKADAEAVKTIEHWAGGEIFFADKMQTTAEVTGTACVIPRYNERSRKIQMGLYGGEYITPWYELGDTENLLGFELEFYQDRIVDGQMKRASYYERWDNRVTPEYPSGRFFVSWGDETLAEGHNPYFPHLPLIPFRARTNPESWYGSTPIDAVVDANQVLNEYLTEFKEIVDFQGFSMLVRIGGVMGSEQQIGPARTIDLPPSGPGLQSDAKYIQPGAPLAELLAFFDWWIRWTANQAQVPVGLINASVSQVESGYALTIRWKPFLGAINRRKRLYSKSERDLWEVALYMARVHSGSQEMGLVTPLNPSENAHEKMILDWSDDALPTDPREEREADDYDINMGLASPITIYLRKNPDVSEAQAEKNMEANIETRDRLRALGAAAQERVFELEDERRRGGIE